MRCLVKSGSCPLFNLALDFAQNGLFMAKFILGFHRPTHPPGRRHPGRNIANSLQRAVKKRLIARDLDLQFLEVGWHTVGHRIERIDQAFLFIDKRRYRLQVAL